MTGARKRYDSKYKVTRILLADYLLLKGLSQAAGGSMAEALHELIASQAIRAKSIVTHTQIPILQFVAAARPAFTARAKPVLSTNGHIPITIKAKGGVIADG